MEWDFSFLSENDEFVSTGEVIEVFDPADASQYGKLKVGITLESVEGDIPVEWATEILSSLEVHININKASRLVK